MKGTITYMKNKNKLKLKGKLKGYFIWPLFLVIVLLCINIWIYTMNIKAGVILSICISIYVIFVIIVYQLQKPVIFKEIVDFAVEYGRLQKNIVEALEIPYGIMDNNGKIMWVNEKFASLFGAESRRSLNNKSISSIFPEITDEILLLENDSARVSVNMEAAWYRIQLKKLDISKAFEDNELLELDDNTFLISINITDQTELKRLMKENQDEKMVAGLIYIDNYEEALESIEEVRRSLLVALIDRKINKYITNVHGLIKKTEKDKYFIIIKQKFLNALQSNKFSILDEVKSVNIGNEMAITISIGLGIGGASYIQNSEFSRAAIDLALGRGGDQAVLKDGEKVYYYGGKSKSVEKNTRVKARIKAHALRELVETKDIVMIMGHKLGDVDSLGAAIGLYRAMKTFEKKTHIVINEITSSLRQMYDKFDVQSGYEEDLFVDSNEALNIVSDNTLVIVVDVNRPNYTECPELLKKSKAIVVLDHHRKSSDNIENAVLSYIEPYSSSACEMVAEILQYISDDIRLKPQEADVLYSGIILDTNNFNNKTGVRTFEAAAFLKRSGADMIRVRKMFRDTEAEYKARAEAVRNAEIFEGVYAISESPTEGIESPTVVGAQAANELLDIKGIKASFIFTQYNSKIYISARSIDEVNVQLIMERLGGGGHLNVAGTQIEGCTVKDAIELLKETIKGMIEDNDI